MNIPNDLLFTKDHEWIRIVNNIAILGVTEYAQGELGDIIFIEFPEKGTKFESSDSIGTIEAVKTVADIFTPIAGEILEVNVLLEENPELIYKDPYKNGWIIKLCNISKDISNLISATAYKDLIK